MTLPEHRPPCPDCGAALVWDDSLPLVHPTWVCSECEWYECVYDPGLSWGLDEPLDVLTGRS
jgi:hypothetical protein